MGADNRTVEDAMFHVWVEGEVLKHTLPNTFVTPAGEAFVDAIPVAIRGGQEAPLCARSVDSQHGFQEAAAGCLIANVSMWVAPQKGPQFGPVLVRQRYSCHTTTVPALAQMSTEPNHLR